LIDVVPTLLQLADLPAGAGASRTDGGGVRGRPLFALRRGLAPAIFGRRYRPAPNPDQAAFAEESAFVILPSGRRQPTTARQVVLYSGDLKLIRAGGRDELYDLTSDPSEISNLVASRPAQAESLGHRLGLLVRALGEQGEGSRPDVEETLRALGYIR
jgi:arylsulfatase A-like enzyme